MSTEVLDITKKLLDAKKPKVSIEEFILGMLAKDSLQRGTSGIFAFLVPIDAYWKFCEELKPKIPNYNGVPMDFIETQHDGHPVRIHPYIGDEIVPIYSWKATLDEAQKFSGDLKPDSSNTPDEPPIPV